MIVVGTHVCKILHHVRCSVKTYQTVNYTTRTTNQHSFTVSYLINSCGLSPQSALSVSKLVNFKTPVKPDSVLSFLRDHGFSKAHISDLVKRAPSFLLSDPKKTLLPKIEFFHSKGFSSTDLARISSCCPMLLKCSLENKIIPSYNFFKSLLKSDVKTIRAIKRCPTIIYHDLQTYMIPNINVLQSNGVPESNIAMLLQNQPRVLIMKSERFNKIAENVKAMGFNPSRFIFVIAIHAMRAMSKSTWERKVDVYERWGWSKEEILVAFGKHPWCMMASENKIDAVLDFLINKMGCQSSYIAQRPILISLSLEKRIVPRCSVLQVLLSKGLINRFSLAQSLVISEKLFIKRYVTQYEDQALHLMKLYQEKNGSFKQMRHGIGERVVKAIKEQL